MRYNFILSTKEPKCIPNNTVGLYIKVLLQECAAFSCEVAYNGSVVTFPIIQCPKNPTIYTPRRVPIPDILIQIFRDLRLSRQFRVPKSYFRQDYINIVFIGHQTKIPNLRKQHRIIGLFDEPPSIGDNFNNKIIYRHVARRFKKQLTKYNMFWVYHKPAADYLKSIGVESSVQTFPCVLDYSELIPRNKVETPKLPIKIIMASSYLPWHGTCDMIKTLEPLLKTGLIQITCIGNGPDRTQTQRIARDIPAVTFMNGMNYKEYQTFLKQFDFGILWNIPWFNSPLKLMDYARAQIGIITFETRAISDIFPENSYYTINEFLTRLSRQQAFSDYKDRVRTMTHFINNELNTEELKKHLNKFQV